MKNAAIKYCLFWGMCLLLAACGNKTKSASGDNPLFKKPPLKELTDKIDNNPKEADLYFKRGVLLRKMELDSLALNDFKTAVSIDSTKAEYFSAIGDLFFEHKDIAGSTKWLEKALKLNPKDKRSHLKMAKMFIYTKDYTSAFGEINVVLRQDVYDPEGYFLKGMIYKDLNDTDKAISSFQTSVQMDSKYKDAVVQLGLMYSMKKDPLALKYFDNALKLDSNNVFPLFARGVYYQNQNEFEKAKGEYKNAILRDHQYINAYFNTAYILMQQDSFEKAWRQYDLITKIDPANPEGYYNRGFANEKMGKKEAAVADYRQALTFDDKYAAPIEALKRLGVK